MMEVKGVQGRGMKKFEGVQGVSDELQTGFSSGKVITGAIPEKKGKKKKTLYAARLSIMPQAGDSSPGIRRADLDIFSMGVGGGSTSTTFEVSVTEFHHHQISVWTRTASLFVINQFEFSG